MPSLKLDLHVHTVGSPDAHTRIGDLPGIISARGLDGVAVTEHDNFDPHSFSDILIVPGVEISSKDGHVIALGIQERIPAGLPADETITRIHDQHGIAIIAHPHDPVSKCVKIARLKVRPDAVETMNADALSFYISNWLSRKDARRFKLPEVGGSDSHIPESIGDVYTVIEASSRDLKSVLEAIKAGKVHPEGHATSIRNKIRKLSYKFT
jgi:predicted metal-dependent phosphoesterase TrpH